MNHFTRADTRETVLTNAELVLPDGVVRGTLVLRGDRIAAAEPGLSALPGAVDLNGDLLVAGVVDLHTDNLERQVEPRARTRWPSRSAMLAHDAQCAAAGVTTVLDALCLGDLGFEEGRMQTFRDGVQDGDALANTGLLKAEHFLHLRCELPAPGMPALLDGVADHPRVRMASLMDHCPGIGQFADVDRWRAMRRREGRTEAEVEERLHRMRRMRAEHRDPNRHALLERFRSRAHAVPLASHDDRTDAEVAENHADGIRISEFPVAMEAAVAARRLGMAVIAGAPNIVRGGSHSGNVCATALLSAGAADALASDYVPSSLIEAAFRAAAEVGLPLPAAMALVTARPAELAGLHDRGRLLPGLRADAVRVRRHEGLPVVREVWRAGERVA